MDNIKKILIAIIAVLLLSLISIIVYFSGALDERDTTIQNNDSEHVKLDQELQKDIDELELANLNQENIIMTLEEEKTALNSELMEMKEYVTSLDSGDVALQAIIEQKYGIKDYSIISKDLFLKPGLITQEPVLGGTMFFAKVKILSDKWAFAEFEDGHILGYGLYEYAVSDAGEITWSVIDDYILE